MQKKAGQLKYYPMVSALMLHILEAKPTAVQIVLVKSNYEEVKKVYNLHTLTDLALKNFLMAAVKTVYFSGKNKDDITRLELIEFFKLQYWKILDK